MCQGEGNGADTEPGRELRGSPVKAQGRAASWRIHDFKVLPPDAEPPPCSDRLHTGFLGRKPGGIALVAICFALYIGNLQRSINAFDKTSPVTLNRAFNPVYFRKINPGADNHSSVPAAVMVNLPCFTPFVLIRASASR